METQTSSLDRVKVSPSLVSSNMVLVSGLICPEDIDPEQFLTFSCKIQTLVELHILVVKMMNDCGKIVSLKIATL